MDGILLLLEFLHKHLRAVRNLLIVVKEKFLTDNLGDKEAGRLIGERILPKERRIHRKQFHDTLLEIVDIEVLCRTCREYLSVWQTVVPLFHKRFQFAIPFEEVNLIDHQQYRHFLLGHTVKEILILFRILHNVSDVKKYIGISERTFREFEHRFLKLVFRFQHTRSVGIYNLILGSVDNTHDTVACGLRL